MVKFGRVVELKLGDLLAVVEASFMATHLIKETRGRDDLVAVGRRQLQQVERFHRTVAEAVSSARRGQSAPTHTLSCLVADAAAMYTPWCFNSRNASMTSGKKDSSRSWLSTSVVQAVDESRWLGEGRSGAVMSSSMPSGHRV